MQIVNKQGGGCCCQRPVVCVSCALGNAELLTHWLIKAGGGHVSPTADGGGGVRVSAL